MELIKLEEVNNKIVVIRDTNVILDSDVAALYGVETREITQQLKTIRISFLMDMFLN